MPKLIFSPRRLLLLLSFSLMAFSVLATEIPLRGPMPFEAMDKNGDNMLSPQEYVEAHNLRKKMRAEANMPGGRMMEPGFNYFDSDGDNLVSRKELEEGRASWQESRGGGQGPGMGNNGMGPGGGMGRGMGRNMPSFAEFDLNGDGDLTKEEFYDARAKRMYDRAEQGYQLRNAASAPAFEEIDTNSDGKIDPDEFKTHQAQHRQMRNQ